MIREHVTCTPPPNTNKAAHSGLETQSRCHTSISGVSVTLQNSYLLKYVCGFSFLLTFVRRLKLFLGFQCQGGSHRCVFFLFEMILKVPSGATVTA